MGKDSFAFQESLNKKPPLKGEGDQQSWWRGSSVKFATASNRFHKELRFFFSSLKRSKKRKEFALHLYYIAKALHEDYAENLPLM